MIKKIVSLAPSNTEIIFALGEDSKLVGVTDSCNYPSQAELKEKIGGFAVPDIEKIIALVPDLVLGTDFHSKKIVPQLRAKGMPVYVVESKTILEAPKAISFIGKLIGCENKSLKLAGEIQEKIGRISRKTKYRKETPKVCYICSSNPLRIAPKSCCCAISKLIENVGGINISQCIISNDKDKLLENVIQENPEVIITAEGHMETADLFSYIINEPVFKQTSAYLNKRIYPIDAELICRSGPRAAEGLETLAKFIHPEVFYE